jgi:hypothetical protein
MVVRLYPMDVTGYENHRNPSRPHGPLIHQHVLATRKEVVRRVPRQDVTNPAGQKTHDLRTFRVLFDSLQIAEQKGMASMPNPRVLGSDKMSKSSLVNVFGR